MSVEDALQKLQALCRVCLSDPGVVNIFRVPSVLRMLACFVPFQISEEDGLSTNMCKVCLRNLKIAFHFRRRCLESQKKFCKLLKINHQRMKAPKFEDKGGTRVKADLDSLVKVEFAEIEIKEEPLDILESELKQEQDSCVLNSIEKISSNGEINVKPVKLKRDKKIKNKDKTKRQKSKSTSKNISQKKKTKIKPTDLSNTIQETIPEKVMKKNSSKKELANNKIQFTDVLVDDDWNADDGSSSKANNFSCSYCPRVFTDADLFKDHKHLHSKETEECDICKKVLTGRNKIEIHRKSHEKHPCQICGKLFTKGNLVKHEKKTHEKVVVPRPCPICKKILTGIDYFRVHVKAHTKKREFHCDMCKKVFASKMGLKSHMDRHNSVRPYACSYCDMTFVILKTKKDHECLHTGQRPHGCPLCEKTFIQKSNMKSHFVHNHRHYDYKEVMRNKNTK